MMCWHGHTHSYTWAGDIDQMPHGYPCDCGATYWKADPLAEAISIKERSRNKPTGGEGFKAYGHPDYVTDENKSTDE